MAKYSDIFEELGLAKNEARIYEALLHQGESGVGGISVKSGIHRRNAYDSLNRLIERGLVFERITSSEHLYQATDPRKLLLLVKEKEERLQNILPDLEKIYHTLPHTDDVVLYHGIEGWKNYMRDIVRVGKDVYSIGAKGTWQDNRLTHVLAQTARESAEKGMHMYWLFDHAVSGAHTQYLEQGFNATCRYLPEGYDTGTAVDIFGDHVVIINDPAPGTATRESSFTVIVNQRTADAFRTWFDLLWIMSDPNQPKHTKRNSRSRTKRTGEH